MEDCKKISVMHIIWKGFRYNIRNFIVFFLSAIFSVATIFGFSYLQQMTSEIKIEGIPSSAGSILTQHVIAIIIVSICIMTYASKFYLRTRIKDYSLLLILGIKKKMFTVFLIMEYVFSWLISIVLGIFFGTGLVYGVRFILNKLSGNTINYASVDFRELYLRVIMFSVIMMLGVIVAIFVYIEEKDLSALLSFEFVKEKKVPSKIAILCCVAGGMIILCSVLVATQVDASAKSDAAVGIIVSMLGVYFLVRYGLQLWHDRKKKTGRETISDILKHSDFYYFLSRNMKIFLVQCTVGVFFIYLVWTMQGSLGKYDETNYPYDFVCTMSSDYVEDVSELNKNLEGDTRLFAAIESYYGDAEYIGLSEKTAYEIWGEDFKLHSQEVAHLWGGDGGYYGSEDAEQSLQLSLGWENRVYNRTETYKVVKEKHQKLFGNFLPAVVVFSDEKFEELFAEDEANYYITTMNVNKEQVDFIADELKQIKNDQKDFQIYNKKQLLHFEMMEEIISLVITGFSALSLVCYMVFVVILKLYSDLSYMRKKNEFLRISGMRKNERRKVIKSEVKIQILPPVLITMIFGLLHCLAYTNEYIRRSKTTFKLLDKYENPSILWILPQEIFYAVFIGVFTFIICKVVIKWVEGNNKR